jgi:molybdate transport system ATP-binding protein
MTLEVDIRVARDGFALETAFTAEAGAVTAVAGRSGAGKSTLIQTIAGLLPQAEGRVVLGGRPLLDSAAGVRVPAHRRRVGVVFQEGRLFPHLSVAENLRYGARRSGVALPEDLAAHELIATLGIAQLLGRRPATLSGGERQRVALGRALLAEPELLLLDEPLASLDAARRAEILPAFERIRDFRRIPILYVSHAVEEIARLADRVVAIEAGKVVRQGPVEEVLTEIEARDGGEAFEPGAVVAATVVSQDAAAGLTDLAIGSTALAAPAFPAAVGARVRLRIRARDVMIALDPPSRVSANNILPVTIARIARHGGAATLTLDCEGQTLTAQITTRACDRLKLREGLAAYAVIKSVTIAR